eukprot:gene7726-8344_t
MILLFVSLFIVNLAVRGVKAQQSFSGTFDLQKAFSGINIKNTPEIDSMTGRSVSNVGDMNGDGFGDIATSSASSLYIIYGSNSALNVNLASTFAGIIINGFSTTDEYISAVGIGDINNDHYSDILVCVTSSTATAVPSYFIVLGSKSSDLTTIDLSSVMFNDNVKQIIIPSKAPTAAPTEFPTEFPTEAPTEPTSLPSSLPSSVPEVLTDPSSLPSSLPSSVPEVLTDPSSLPSSLPSAAPSANISFLSDPIPERIGQTIHTFSTDDFSSTDDTPPTDDTPATPDHIFLLVSPVMSGIGDINNDGFNDLIVLQSITQDGQPLIFTVLFGGSKINQTITVDELTVSEGFTVIGDTVTGPSITNYYYTSAYDYGASVGWAGDVNNDGYNDIVIGSPLANNEAGEVFVIFGRPLFNQTLNLSSLYSTKNRDYGFVIYGSGQVNGDGSLLGDYVGFSVAGNFDINNDGISDLIIGAPYAKGSFGITYVIYGSSTINQKAINNGIYLERLTTKQGFGIYSSALALLGWSVASAGDYSGDGIDDVIIGAPGAAGGAGVAFIIYGSSSTMTTIQLSTLTASQGKEIIGIKNTGKESNYCQTGKSVSGGFDFNRDGLSDVVIGAVNQDDLTYTSAGATYVVFGTTATTAISLKYLASVFTYSSPEASSDDSASPNFVKTVGDIDLNGYTDIGIGFFENAAAYLVLGNKNGADSISSLQGISGNEGYFINSTNLESWLGYSLDSAGDMNDDGFNDWMIGAPGKYSYFPYYADYIFYYSTPTIASNSIPAVYIIYGGKSVQSLTVSNYSLNYPDRGTVITGDRTSGLGISVAYVPNLQSKTNSQRTFIALGAPFTSNYDGAVYIIAGSSSLPSQIKLTQPSQVTELGIITITAVPGSKGYLGWAVSSAGDIDGDGYTDVLIAAPNAGINSGGTTVYNCGVIYLLYGKSLQAGTTIALENFTSNQGLLFYGANMYDNAGMAVSGIGDINGDGYADYAIGVPYYNSFTGITYVIYGNSAFSTSTISLGSISSSQGFTLTGDQTNDFSGFAIAPAGDINHDGLADFIISSPGNNIYAGTVYIVFGAKQGSMTSNSIDLSSLTSDQGVTIVNNVLYTMVGWSVSSYTDTKGNIMALVGMNPSTAYGETSTAYAVIPSSSPKNTTVTPTARPTVYPTYVPTALPTWSPSAIPTYIPSLTPTMAPTVPPFWQANQAIILGVLIPATTSFIPIYFSKQICFNALENWSALNRRRNLFQIGIYNLCKKIYLADYMEALETKKAKKDHDKEEKDKEALLKPNIELTVLEKLKQMKDSESRSSSIMMMNDDMSSSHGVMNPMLSPAEAERSPSFHRSTLHIEEERSRQSVAFRQSTTLIDSDDEDEDARGRDEEEGGGGLPPHPLAGRGSGSGKGGNDVIVKAVYSFTYDNPEIELMMSQNSFPLSSILGDIKLLPLELPKAEATSIPSIEETKCGFSGLVRALSSIPLFYVDAMVLLFYTTPIIFVALFSNLLLRPLQYSL